jgi:hypothetical protein
MDHLIKDERAQMSIASVIRTDSFDVSFDGVGEAVRHVVHAVDPKARKEREQGLREREEVLRHSAVMNAHTEHTAQREEAVADVEARYMTNSSRAES